ncbi:DNA/RNA non-specific endonuclease [Tamlana fucoidanivorans]|uniref:DNA/RNA non-specific endonuclease n=1 Tax=Allotamlana fucoidanivorans TaxID=2583814 RepID=A0A5C4SJ60_9FLAO|nr:DNA/RNA non-specific endonuclease [Tamlana fucoidanivorans]TNJ43798.1 DNA/RNA non-specific endonuclease [Tamlana fucoidanivorans]
MNKRFLYSVCAVAIVIAVYAFEYILKTKEEAINIEQGQEVKAHTKMFFMPTSTTGAVIHHEGYSLSYHETYEQAEWVAYELKKEHLSSIDRDRPYFEMDKAVKTGAAHWKNYKNSGYDKGHLCPAADKRYNMEAHDETFLTSNISPQNHQFNAGIWNDLEQKVRYWAKKHDGVFVITGGVLNEALPTIGEEQVAVPNQFFKIVLDYNSGHPKLIAFLIPNKDSRKPLANFVVPVDAIETLTGIDFFYQWDDRQENLLEADIHLKDWF